MKNKKPKTPEPFFASKKASVMRELRVDPNFQSWSPATSGAKCHEAKNVMMIWSSLRFNLCYKNNDGAVGQRRSTQRKIQLRKNEPTQHPKGGMFFDPSPSGSNSLERHAVDAKFIEAHLFVTHGSCCFPVPGTRSKSLSGLTLKAPKSPKLSLAPKKR